jgi:hypothetical protein
VCHGGNRDVAIRQLIDGLLYVANRDKVLEERLQLAEKSVGQIEDRLKQAAARAKIMRYRPPVRSIEELEREFARVTSREEKEQLLGRIVTRQLEEGHFGDRVHDEASAECAVSGLCDPSSIWTRPKPCQSSLSVPVCLSSRGNHAAMVLRDRRLDTISYRQ